MFTILGFKRLSLLLLLSDFLRQFCLLMCLVFEKIKRLCARFVMHLGRITHLLLGVGIYGALSMYGAQAQTVTGPPMVLKPSSLLQEKLPQEVRAKLPSFIQADRLTGEPDQDVQLEGSVVFRRGDTVLRADRVDYSQSQDHLKAQGHVSINRAGTLYQGPELDLKVNKRARPLSSVFAQLQVVQP